MPSAPQYLKRPNQPPAVRQPERRESSSTRGYGTAWTAYSLRLRQEKVFCELCAAAFGIETPCAGRTTTESGRKRSQGVTDHVVPPADSRDDLFWTPEGHWVLCQACHSFKSMEFDGTYGKRKIQASSRDLDGIARRKREIIEARRKAQSQLQPPLRTPTER